MPRVNTLISAHYMLFQNNANEIKKAISLICQNESLSVGDTQAIRILTNVYEVLANPTQEMKRHYQEDSNKHFDQKAL